MPRSLILPVAVALLLLVAGDAGARSLAIDHFDSAVSVQPDGSISVQETITARFVGAWNGIYRTIPVEYRTPQGLNYTLRLTIESVTDSMGYSLRYESSRERHYRKLKIWIPHAQDTTQTVTIRYRVANALRFFDEHDELYWNVTGDEWDVPIAQVSAAVLLPPAATGLRATAFRGAYKSTERNDVRIDGHVVTIAANGLAFREGVTAVVGWNPGAVHRPTMLEWAGDFVYSNWQLAMPVGVFLCLWVLWWFRGRDPNPGTVVTLYEPPSNLSPAEAGTLTDGSVDMRDITSTIVDLAVRGYLRVDEKNGQYTFNKLKSAKNPDDLKIHESMMMGGLFAKGDSVSIVDLKGDFYTYLKDIKESLYINLVDRDFYTKRPNDVGSSYTLCGIGIFLAPIVWAVISLTQHGAFGYPSWMTVASCVVTAIVVLVFAAIMPRRTKTGTREYAKVRGFQEFLSRVDADRLQRVVKTPEMFEKYLPYAMALGVETEWARAFHGIYEQPPAWYTADSPMDAFTPSLFTGQLHRMAVDAGGTMSSAPRGSGGSGFGSDSDDSCGFGGGSGLSSGASGGGGGISGGGFGGGGGGGF